MGQIHRIIMALAVGVVLRAPAHAADSAPQVFGARDAVESADLSPNGTHLVYVAPGSGGATKAVVANLDTGSQQVAAVSSSDAERIAWCRFVSDQRLVCQIAGAVDTAGLIVPFSRLFSVNTDGSLPRPLGQRHSSYDARVRQVDGSVVDWMSGDDNTVLMAREYVPETGKMNTRLVDHENGMAVDRIDVATLESHHVELPSKAASVYFSDGRGVVRMKGFTPNRGGSGQLASHTDYSYRLAGSTQWLPFSTWDGDAGMLPLRVDGLHNAAYVLKKLNGRLALWRVSLDGSLHETLLYKNDVVDVDDVVTLGRDETVIGVTFADEARRDVYFDPDYAALATSLTKALPDAARVRFVAASRDHSRLLLSAASGADPGRYYLFDRGRRKIDPLLLVRPGLEGIPLAKVRAVQYTAADGTSIPAYVTLPPGNENAKNLPGVVLPHGGPSARDDGDFDWLAQFLAHEGYAVIQPNYRGSAGYGDEWRRANGFRGWKTSIGDVVDAGRWLVSQGIADPARLAAVGWSYGGYASLQSSIVQPNMFKAVVAVAPVTDLDLLKRESRDYNNARNVAEEIGSGVHLTEGSPLQNVERIRVPVLLFHGTLDHTVPVQQSRALDSKLRSAGKLSELVLFDGLDHQLRDSDARTKMLERLSAFLSTNLK